MALPLTKVVESLVADWYWLLVVISIKVAWYETMLFNLLIVYCVLLVDSFCPIRFFSADWTRGEWDVYARYGGGVLLVVINKGAFYAVQLHTFTAEPMRYATSPRACVCNEDCRGTDCAGFIFHPDYIWYLKNKCHFCLKISHDLLWIYPDWAQFYDNFIFAR